MNLSKFTDNEKTALAGLSNFLLLANRRISQAEIQKLSALADKFGDDEYRRFLARFYKKCQNFDSFRSFLKEVGRQPAREDIYKFLLGLATTESINPVESDFLDWLANEWQITVGFDIDEHFDEYQ